MVTMTAPQGQDPQHDRDDDAVFRQIVAGFGEEPTDVVPRWPVSEDVDADVDLGADLDTTEPAPAGDVEGLPGWVEPDALPDEGHYVPPAPPRLPRPRLRTVAALAVMLAGFAVLFFPYTVGFDDSPGSLVLGMLLVAGGVTLLVSSMRDAPGSDDRPDNGAVV